MTISSPQRPRKDVVIAGVSASHMLVSQISAWSARSSSRLASRNGGRFDAARLLLALEQHGDRQRQRARHLLPGAAGLDEGHQLALVVGGAATDHDLRAVVPGQDLRVERVVVPELERVDRLHVVVAVEEQRRPRAVALVADHHRMAGGVAHAGVEADLAQVGGVPLGAGAGLGGIGRVGRDRLQPQRDEQALERGVEVGVDGVENLVEVGHRFPQSASFRRFRPGRAACRTTARRSAAGSTAPAAPPCRAASARRWCRCRRPSGTWRRSRPSRRGRRSGA